MNCIMKLDILAYYRYVKIISKITNDILYNLGFDNETVYLLRLAVSEATTNIIEHSYARENRNKIEYKIYEGEGFLEFNLRDYGKQVSKQNIKSRDLEDFEEGGLGVYIIDSVMDEVKYIHKEVGTQLIMRKKIGAEKDGGTK